MAAETKVIIDMEQKGIEITCKHCGKSQTYTMRSKEIPKRPKTQCQNCEKWIYIDRSLLVKNDQNEDDQNEDDQKNIKQATKSVEKSKKSQIKELPSLTKTDQMTKSKTSIKENRGHQEVISIEQMSQEIELFGRTIPVDKVREIARETLLGHRVMMEGVKSWLGVWKTRYYEYIEDKPEHFLIDKYKKAQETLEFLYKVEKLFKEITNGKS